MKDGLLVFKGSYVSGRLEPNGELVWSHGFTTKLEGDLCPEDISMSESSEELETDSEPSESETDFFWWESLIDNFEDDTTFLSVQKDLGLL